MVQQQRHNTEVYYMEHVPSLLTASAASAIMSPHTVFAFRFLSSGIRDHVGGPVSGCGDKRPGIESSLFVNLFFLLKR